MKKLLFLSTLLVSIAFLSACKKDEDKKDPGTLEINFDNIAIVNGVEKQLSLVAPGSADYNYTNEMGQNFNINLLRYFISAIELDGPNGEHFHDEMSASASGAKGYYLIDESIPSSQRVMLENIPAGNYNKITFTVGVDSAGVVDGAAGGVLDPATNKMFWNWNSGYIALKFEGQSDVSNGGTSGTETIADDNQKGIAYHIGGWKNIPGTAFVYNNKQLTFTFDENVKVESKNAPELHMVFDILSMFKGDKMIDFTGNHNVHKPADGVDMANNIAKAFAYDHIHQ
ncbi:MAG: hypothetical protein H6577_20005 [Lewinellaceae bacterium]|nr:hypothetical protein [Saprospiraceae bacterium]MCB9340414.1 hypothetical protein [Lewinellaceae bacterium]